jgi:putative (di)nucleoside polyphosphate hydrolase
VGGNGRQAEHVEIVARLPEELFYDLPDDLKGKLWGGCYLGQRQNWYLARFTGSETDIDIDAHDPPEFCEYRWVAPERLPDLIVPFKRDVYAAVVAGFRDLI